MTATTTDFLFELGTEELPPTALGKLSKSLTTSITNGFADQQLQFKSCESFATPRRLALLIKDLDVRQPDSEQTKLGPAVAAAFDAEGNASKAAEGFARSCNVAVTDLQHIDTDKGVRLGLTITSEGQPTSELIPAIIKSALKSLPIPKAMRWGNRDESFVRPVKWLVALLDEQILDLTLYGCNSDRTSHGHRFMSEGVISINTASSYAAQLRDAFVIVSQPERKAIISQQTNELAKQQNLTAIVSPELLDEVSALVEWPVALIGRFEREFLSVPKEALISTMSKNQKYFHLLTETGELANRFITIANLESKNPLSIVSGNERVIRPRLADAKFFYEQDCKRSLTAAAKQLEKIVFQKELGSVADKCSRIAIVAQHLAAITNADASKVKTAAEVCKADLVSEMVGEFPNLQGTMGKYYAKANGLDDEICAALEEIYLPRTASDKLPTTATGVCLALADRIDTLVGIFGIQQLPSGNKDPYALRRAALGIIRIIIDHNLDIDFHELILSSISSYDNVTIHPDTEQQLLAFFVSRSRAMYSEQGYSIQTIAAVEAIAVYKPVDFNHRLKAVTAFAELSESESLAAANKRVANILSKNASGSETIETNLLSEPAEIALYDLHQSLQQEVMLLCRTSQYTEALDALVSFKDPLDQFFDNIMVMAEDVSIRNNRIALLAGVRSLFLSVADISFLQK